MAPRDFPAPEIAWRAGAGQNYCRVDISGPAVSVTNYANITRGVLGAFQNPNIPIPATLFAQFFVGRDDIDLVFVVSCGVFQNVGGQLTLVNGTIWTSNPVTYRVSRYAAGGRIVYFSGFVAGLWKIEIGGFNSVTDPWVGPTAAFAFRTADCIGCHSFSGRGNFMSYANFDQEFGILENSGPRPTSYLPRGRAEWTALHPTAQWMVGIDSASNMNLYDSTTGALIMRIPTSGLGPLATQAFWSPVGDKLAFVTSRVPGAEGVLSVEEGSIWTLDFTMTGTTPTFTNPTLIAEPSTPRANAYYPAFSPDGRYIVFCRAPSGQSYANLAASLWLVPTDLSTAPVELARANRGPVLANSWPRWAPRFRQGHYWIVYSSERPYSVFIGGGPQQLWVTEIDTNALPGDPSSPGIWLPGQEPFTGNLTAEWSATQ